MHVRWAIIVGGGSGARIGGEMPKQFMTIAGKPVIIHTIAAFLNAEPDIKLIAVIPEDYKQKLKTLLKEFFPTNEIKICTGGTTRFDSVKNGLSAIKEEEGVVAVHDAVRPMVSPDLIRRCFIAAQQKTSAIPAIELKDSIRKKDDSGKFIAMKRDDFKIIQTPQVFEINLLRKAYMQSFNPDFTDDASVVERSKGKINLVEGDPENIKITYPVDLEFVSYLLEKRNGEY